MKIEEGDLLIPPRVVRETFDWWSGKDYYPVEALFDGRIGVVSDDGDFYPPESLFSNGYINVRSERCFDIVKSNISLENE